MLRTVRLNLKEDDRDYYVFVMTKKDDGEVREIVNDIVNNLNNEEMSFFDAREQVLEQVSEGVSESSFKKFNFIVDFGDDKLDQNQESD